MSFFDLPVNEVLLTGVAVPVALCLIFCFHSLFIFFPYSSLVSPSGVWVELMEGMQSMSDVEKSVSSAKLSSSIEELLFHCTCAGSTETDVVFSVTDIMGDKGTDVAIP